MNGIEAWDCLLEETVLLVPWVLSFQGDNPMSCAMASHVGMSGRYYCRACLASSCPEVEKGQSDDLGDAQERERIRTFMMVRLLRRGKWLIINIP